MSRRVALVTGSGNRSGIGFAIVRALASNGLAVAFADVANAAENGEATLDELDAELRAEGHNVFAVEADLSNESEAERLVKDVIAHFGQLDVLVNNAAAELGADRNDIAEVPAADWDRVFAINSRAAFLLCRGAVPDMRRRSWGRIVNISSLSALVGSKRSAVYSASKAALLGMTRSLALDVARDGITVNAICPGIIHTSRMVSRVRRTAGDDVEQHLAMEGAEIPVGRQGKPEEVAATAAFLASDGAAYITGEAITVAGGLTSLTIETHHDR